MKKLLSLLSVLTISGNAVPTTIAASPYQKEEKLNNDTNLQTNNLETLNRYKRQAPNKKKQNVCNKNIENTLLRWDGRLHINNNDYQNMSYQSGISAIIGFLLQQNIIERVFDNSDGSAEQPYSINRNLEGNNSIYFVIPVNINYDNNQNIDLIFRARDLYLQGFTYNETFYHFSDSTITSINGQTSRNLNFDSNYNSLISGNPQIGWASIVQAFNDLTNYGSDERYRRNDNIIRAALSRVILATSETLRFRSIFNLISNTLIQNNGIIYWNHDNNQTNIHSIVTNWDHNSINFSTLDRFVNIDPARNIAIISLGAALYYWNICKNRYGKRDINNLQKVCSNIIFTDLNNNEYCPILEKIIYFNDDKKYIEFETKYTNWKSDNINDFQQGHFITINLGKVNPNDFKKISFIGETSVYSSWGNDRYYGTNINDYFSNKELKNIFLKNKKIVSNEKAYQYANHNLEDKEDSSGFASIKMKQWIGITYFLENNNWYIQILCAQKGDPAASLSGGALWMKIGNGIRLYND
ncbi:ribosome-inactivating family protein [Spiroplasma endosymbiont of Polydrusus cervinus]|uniref:ribosome-inactivating family protein n=1 Tax=Spiroplasma endosymbiont of Polydrusus cervinus TaxID=3066287 RepID=UPI0030CB46C0